MSPDTRGGASDWFRAAAVANCCLIRVWTDLLAYPVWPAHRDFNPPQAEHYLAAALEVVALGTLLWLAYEFLVSRWMRLSVGVFTCLLIAKETFLALSSLGTVQRAGLLKPMPLLLLTLIAGLGTTWAFRNPERVGWLARKAAAAAMPLMAMTLGQSAWQASRVKPTNVAGFNAPARPDVKAPRRVVWMIFDELDERVAFTHPRKGLRLPALERYRREANFVALQAESPANATLVSLPQLLGFVGETGAGADGSVFAHVRRAGGRSAVVGWAVPYCQVFKDWTDTCAWWPMPQQHNSYGEGVGGILRGMAISLFETNQLSPFGQARSVRQFARVVEEMTVLGAETAARPDLDFVFLHLPPPHNPYLYNPGTGKMDKTIVRFPNPEGYFNNLLLADSIFARIRRAMEESGVWENSLVLVTADHGLRSGVPLGYPPDDKHVPFMVKSPEPLHLDPKAPLATERTASLLLEWMNRRGS